MQLLLDWLRHSGDVFLFNLLTQVTVLLAVALAVAYWFRHSAVSKYTILYTAMLSLVLVVAASTLLQLRQLALVSIDVSTFSESTDNRKFGFILETLPFLLDINELLFDASGLNQNSQQIEVAAGTANPNTLNSSTTAAWLLSVWVIGFIVSLVGILRSQSKLNKLIKHARELSARQARCIANALQDVELTALALEFKILPSIKSPLLAGIATPTVYLPEAFLENISCAELQAVLLHEVAHLKRRDIAANYIQKTVRAIFWFHPLVIVADKHIDRSREEICDNYALAKSDPISYGEVLFKVGTLRHQDETISPSLPVLALGIHGKNWKLEDRVKGLLDYNRETDMNLSNRKSALFFTSIVSTAVFISACQIGELPSESSTPESISAESVATLSSRSAETEPGNIAVQSSTQGQTREPPPARSTTVLSDEVLSVVKEIDSLMSFETDETAVKADKLAEAKVLLDQLTVDKFDSLNDFEKATSLNFLTNYYLMLEDYPNSIITFERILEIEELRADVRLRALRSLGQLTSALEQWQNSIDYYDTWRALATAEDQLVFKGLSYAHYQLEEFAPAIRYWESYMGLMKSQDMMLSRDDFAYLNGMYFQTEELDKALALSKEMILQFNDARDWNNLRSIYAMMDNEQQLGEFGDVLAQNNANNAVGIPNGSETYILSGDEGEYLPLKTVVPQYPTQAANEGIEGWVLVSFTVLADGSVDEQSLNIVDSDPVQIFDLSALRAMTDFEFKPRVVDGNAVSVPGVQYLFRYALEDEEL